MFFFLDKDLEVKKPLTLEKIALKLTKELQEGIQFVHVILGMLAFKSSQ